MKKQIYNHDICELSQAEINHLRRLLAWLRCENQYLYLDEDGHVEVAKSLGNSLGEGVAVSYGEKVEKAFNRWPKYVHAAVKALGKTIKQADGDVVDVEFNEQKELPKHDET
jgi:hypothetical protein